MRKVGLFVLYLFFSSAGLLAQQKFSTDILWKLGRVSDPQVAPNGGTIVYNITYADVQNNKNRHSLFTLPVAGGTPVKIADETYNPLQARWRPDGKKIGFLSAKNGSMQLWEMNPDGSDKRPITGVDGGISFFSYSPKMNRIMYGTDVKVDKSVIENNPDLAKTTGRIMDQLNYRHWDTWNDGSYQHIFYTAYQDGKIEGQPVDIMAGQQYDSPLKPMGGEEEITWTPDGNAIAYTVKKETGTQYAGSTNSDIWLFDIASGKEKNLTASNPGYDKDPVFSPDGQYMAYLSMPHASYESDKNRIMLLDLRSGQARDLTEKLDQTTEAVSWSSDSRTLYFISPIQATQQVFAYHLQPEKKQSSVEQLTDGWHDYTSIQYVQAGKKPVIIGTMMSMTAPNEIFSIDAQKKTATQLSFTNKAILDGVKMGKIEKRMVKATDGKDILTWVILPPDFDATKKYPALLYCQGGPQSAVSQFFSTRWNFELMAANGYIVVAPNRRGLPSFGQEWNDAIVGDYGGQPMKDLLSAIDDVAKEPYVNKDKLGAVGASFGGYTVYWLAGHNLDKRFKVFIAHDGMFNMESWYGSTEEMFFANHDQKGPYWENTENYAKFSPHKYVKNWNMPILIIHNELDYRVPVTQGMEAFTAAQMQGVPSRFLYFPDENHWVTKPQNSILWQRTFFDWLDRWLKEGPDGK